MIERVLTAYIGAGGGALLVLAAVTCVVVVGGFVELALGARSLPQLGQEPPLDAAAPRPMVSVVIAARDEAATIEHALRSVLAQDYAPYEVIAVDDRSADGTGAILDRMASGTSTLRVQHVRELPPGWIGKNHALQRGAEAARGDWILFTDADVVFQPSALSRAVGYAERHGVDHLCVGPVLVLRTAPLALAVNFFTLAFMLYLKPWRVRDPSSARHVGSGAFNLGRASAYRAVGRHARIAMRPDDDVKLGKVLKLSGARQQLADGRGIIAVAWYDSLGEMIRGLRKNMFAGIDYSVPMLLLATVATLLLNVWPFVALVTTHGATRALNAVTALALVTMYAASAATQRSRPWLAIAHPVGALLFLWAVWGSALSTLVHGGISWRGTRYSLRELRANRV